jgi:hypothetical protein
MKTEQTEIHELNVSTEKFLNFVSQMIGADVGREDDAHPLPPGPWDPVIRAALERTYTPQVADSQTIMAPWPQPWRVSGPSPDPWRFAGPQPDPWFLEKAGFSAHSLRDLLATILARHPEIYDAIGGGHNPGSTVALNPQPLPPRVHFMVSVAKIVIARAGLLGELAGAVADPGERQGIIIVGGYVKRFCEGWCGSEFRVRWPFPGPHPRWFTEELNGLDLVVLAAEFQQGSREAFNSDLRQSLADASAQLVEAGVSRMG